MAIADASARGSTSAPSMEPATAADILDTRPQLFKPVESTAPEEVLSRRSVAWRYGLSALWYVVAAVALLTDSHLPWWMVALDLGVGLAMFGVIRFRRRFPLAVSLALSAMLVLGSSGGLVALWGFASLCTRRRWPAALVGLLALAAGALSSFAVTPGGFEVWQREEGQSTSEYLDWLLPSIGLWVAVFVTAGVLGMFIGTQRKLRASLRERAETAEREQELRVAQGQADERTRIAREMHDVLAHRMSLVSMHAGALEYRTDLSADEMREVAGVIQSNAHQALEELRTVLTGLRDHDSDAAPEKPQPTLAQMPDLIEEGQAAGQHITVVDEVVDIDKLPTQTGRHAYRVVQEGLTNARKHAPHARTTLTMTGAPASGLSLRLSNPRNHRGGVVPGAKVGLVGLTERATIAGGRLEHYVDDEDNFVLEVWLPW